MSKRKRDSAYYLKRLGKECPDVYERWRVGELPSVRAACREAKLGDDDAPLKVLKRAWRRASATDRRAFVDWAKASKARIATAILTGRDLIGTSGYLTEPIKKRIQARIEHEDIKMGVLMKKLGFNHLDGSLGNARTGSRLRPAVAEAVAKWLGSPMP